MLLQEATDTRYEIVKILGQGASATVYQARHIALNELRVLKVLHHDMMLDARRRQKFLLEAQVAAHLKHPAIVRVFDVTQTATKLQIEMEFIEGLSLRQHLERRRNFPLSVSLAIVCAVLEGLEHAHTARLTFGDTVFDGVIHRDLKPENIMIRKDGQPVICDFGVAKLGADLMTQTQHISGSVAYMAPERLRGELSTRSIDVFSLGVMLFELHKGCRPFPGANKTQVLENILRWNIADLDAEWRGSDAAVLQIVKRSLTRDAAQRYADASQMLAAVRPVYRLYHGEARPAEVIHAFLTRGQFTTAEFKALMPEEGLFSRRAPLLISAVAAAAIGATVWLAWPRERPAADESPLERVLREQGLAAAEGAVRSLAPEEQQRGYYALAKASFYDRKDPGNALLLSNKALNLGFHPAIAALRAEILIDQGTVNLAESELKRMESSLPRMAPETRAQYHWLSAQVQLRRMETGDKSARAKAREALRRFIDMRPEGREAALEQAERQLQSLE
jgi:tRNA A-37 threonylcarbamoyl transferase component Bud32